MTNSPLINDGDLQLNPKTGDLIVSPDIITQMYTTLVGTNGVGNSNLTSELISYINQIPIDGIKPNIVSAIILNAYDVLIKKNLISDLKINVTPIGTNYIMIDISAIDIEGNNQTLKWSNA
jgi:hypothetical protein